MILTPVLRAVHLLQGVKRGIRREEGAAPSRIKKKSQLSAKNVKRLYPRKRLKFPIAGQKIVAQGKSIIKAGKDMIAAAVAHHHHQIQMIIKSVRKENARKRKKKRNN